MAPTTDDATKKAPRSDRTLGQLIAQASQDVSTLIRQEIALAKAELRSEVKQAVAGAALFVAAAALALLALPLLLAAAAWGLVAAGLPAWAGFGIVGLVLLLIVAILALLGKRAVSKVGAPERTIRSAKETVSTLKGNRGPSA